MTTLPTSFTPLHPNKQVTVSNRHLPHWRQMGATYFVTFRLADSLPQTLLRRLKSEREAWLVRHVDPTDDECKARAKAEIRLIDESLDRGSGSCLLANRAATDILEERLRYFDGEQYNLFSFVTMPNHVHACLKPLGDHELDRILEAWKSVSSSMINRALGLSGGLWQRESFDRIVRDSEHLRRVIAYIEANPEKGGVKARAWTTPSWDSWLGR